MSSDIGTIIQSFSMTFELVTFTDSVVTEGIITATPTTTEITGVIYPARGDELIGMPDTDRGEAEIWVFTETELFTGGPLGLPADRIIYAGRQWEVRRCEPWEYGAFFRSRAALITGQG